MQWYVARCSYGNDSVAMLQVMHEFGLKNVFVVYSDTGWGSDEWIKRVEKGEEWVKSLGYIPIRLSSQGFESVVKTETKQGMWPTRLRKFCTRKLKIEPFIQWANVIDPDKRFLICVGVRRAESRNRASHPAFMPEKDDGRHVWHPLIEFSDADRDALIERTPFDVLPHRSDECAVCIHANRADLQRAPQEHIDRIERIEQEIGRPMFDPKRYMGAEGIREVVRWAHSERGQYKPEEDAATCEDNWCGL